MSKDYTLVFCPGGLVPQDNELPTFDTIDEAVAEGKTREYDSGVDCAFVLAVDPEGKIVVVYEFGVADDPGHVPDDDDEAPESEDEAPEAPAPTDGPRKYTVQSQYEVSVEVEANSPAEAKDKAAEVPDTERSHEFLWSTVLDEDGNEIEE